MDTIMGDAHQVKKANFFEQFSSKVTQAMGNTPAFIIAPLAVMIWVARGPLFKFSEQWQLVINLGTTIIIFLMVFLIQKVRNKHSLAI